MCKLPITWGKSFSNVRKCVSLKSIERMLECIKNHQQSKIKLIYNTNQAPPILLGPKSAKILKFRNIALKSLQWQHCNSDFKTTKLPVTIFRHYSPAVVVINNITQHDVYVLSMTHLCFRYVLASCLPIPNISVTIIVAAPPTVAHAQTLEQAVLTNGW